MVTAVLPRFMNPTVLSPGSFHLHAIDPQATHVLKDYTITPDASKGGGVVLKFKFKLRHMKINYSETAPFACNTWKHPSIALIPHDPIITLGGTPTFPYYATYSHFYSWTDNF